MKVRLTKIRYRFSANHRCGTKLTVIKLLGKILKSQRDVLRVMERQVILLCLIFNRTDILAEGSFSQHLPGHANCIEN